MDGDELSRNKIKERSRVVARLFPFQGMGRAHPWTCDGESETSQMHASHGKHVSNASIMRFTCHVIFPFLLPLFDQ